MPLVAEDRRVLTIETATDPCDMAQDRRLNECIAVSISIEVDASARARRAT